MSKKERRAVAAARKAALRRAGHTFSALAGKAEVTYSMAEKWMNARRNSADCERAFAALTRLTA